MFVLNHTMSRYAFYCGTDWIDEAFLRWATSPHGGTGIPSMRQKFKAPYRTALQYKGRQHTIIAARDRQSGNYVGMVVLSARDVYIRGALKNIAYVSELYIDPGHRNPALGRGMYYHFIQTIKNYDGLLASAFASNRPLLDMIIARKNSPIAFSDIGTLYTHVFYPKVLPTPSPSSPIHIQPLHSEAMLDAFLEFWHHRKDDRDFIPAYAKSDILTESGQLRDLRLDDILIATKGDEIVGSIGLWDQSPTRTWFVDRYPIGLRLLRPLLNLVARWRGIPTLPNPGDEIPYLLVCLLRVKDDDPEVLWSLFHALSKKFQRHRKQPLFVCALHQRDPLRKWMQWPHYPITSRLLFSPMKITLDPKRIPYVELGAL